MRRYTAAITESERLAIKKPKKPNITQIEVIYYKLTHSEKRIQDTKD